MNCDKAAPWIGAYADGQLGAFRRYLVGRHLKGCGDCEATHQGLLALRAQVRAEVPYFKAPAELRARLQARFADTRATAPARPLPQRDRWLWLSGGAMAGCAATVLAWVVGAALIDWRVNECLAAEAVTIHT